jgi:fatty-acyl-CoA synthase
MCRVSREALYERVSDIGTVVRAMRRIGLFQPVRPDRLARAVAALRRWGVTMAGGFVAAAQRFPDRPAVIDERGVLTFEELDRRSNALAWRLRDAGIRENATVAVMCRNHRGFVETTAALAKLGADALYCNTGFAAAQLRQVVQREHATAIIFDEDFTDVVASGAPAMPGFLAWHAGSRTANALDTLIAAGDKSEPPPMRSGRTIILTSGTTGTPRGVVRRQTAGAGPLVALCSALPVRPGETTVIAAPLFHSWGFGHLVLATVLGSTVIVQRRFDPVATLEAVARHRATMLVAVPVMLRRILDVPDTIRRAYDVSTLRIVAVSGSSLPALLATRFMDTYGDILYNLYGSTEVAYATLAGPGDLRASPSTAGYPMRGTTVAVLDGNGQPVPQGTRGHIFVGNELSFDGYTGGGMKASVRGLVSTGDVGRFDADGRLTVEGRADDMIVSGGENVFPEEVEHLLAGHDGIADVAVVGVADEHYGQRLKAFVVRQAGSELSAEAVRAYVRANLARHKVPGDVVFTDEVPRNATGKVVRGRIDQPRDPAVTAAPPDDAR